MNTFESSTHKPTNNFSQLLLFCLLFSLALHLVAILAFTFLGRDDNSRLSLQKPTVVRLVSPSQKKQKLARDYELDHRPIQQQAQAQEKVESFRKAEQDQKVILEQAPKGNDVRDYTTKPKRPTQQPKSQQIQQNPNMAFNEPQPQQSTISKPSPEGIKPFKPASAADSTRTVSRPTPAQLLPDQKLLQQIAQGAQANKDRIKERSDAEIGDTVWLNLQSNLLVSFFRRFHNQVELVWNYPAEAAMNGVEGNLELLIIVNRTGELIDVDLKRSSGSDLLDFEAIQAVYRAAPFGQLTKHYPHEVLKIRANFSYNISGSFIYGSG